MANHPEFSDNARSLAAILDRGGDPAAAYDLAVEMLGTEEGVRQLYELAPRFDDAVVFFDTDWAVPEKLQPALVRESLFGPEHGVAIEAMSQLRLLAVVEGRHRHPAMTPEAARAFLESVLALNLDVLFPQTNEATRNAWTPLMDGVHRLLGFIHDHVGSEGILASVVEESERLLIQRPIMVNRVVSMLRATSEAIEHVSSEEIGPRARRLLHALIGPTARVRKTRDHAAYASLIKEFSQDQLSAEANGLAHSMVETGLVCPSHAVLLRHLAGQGNDQVLGTALALDRVGRDSLDAFNRLVRTIIRKAVFPATAQCIQGLSELLNRGVLFFPPVGPSLWRLMGLEIRPEVAEGLREEVDVSDPPSANAVLLSGTLSVLGLPLGVGQGDNPTCQSARAISLWAQVDPGYLLEIVTAAARDADIDMHFEGALLRSTDLRQGLVEELHTELDPVSLVLVPHLDRIYLEMGRRTAGRSGDPHRWINPEFHGWWVWRDFATLVDDETDRVVDFQGFIRRFYACYHPDYNGGQELIYPQPAGIAPTDPHGGFTGWHAVSIQRVTIDPDEQIRVYFYDPNNDGAQDWGHGVRTSTRGHGEYPGESSLPFEQFASRLYVFHYNQREQGDPYEVPDADIERIADMARESWAADREWHDVVPVLK